ncbi:MAG TPA: hypothetical protein VH475_27385 [Tepidisphaeraceae bacterium]|jgi:hypothetical protein
MSYDLTIWKRSARAKSTMTQEVLAAIGEDAAHPAMARFDAHGFIRDLRAKFGGEERWSNEDLAPPFMFEVVDFTGTPANWISVNIGYGDVAAVLPELVKLATEHGLVVFDWQTEKLHGER